jgi:two-component system, OmpR family, sensor histidine kinase ResE
MRWWLPLVFAVIAAATAAAVAQVLSDRVERAFREYAEEIAVGNSSAAVEAVNQAILRGNLEEALVVISNRRQLALFVFDAEGSLTTPERSRQTDVTSIPFRREAVGRALVGDQFVRSLPDGRAVVVGEPLGETTGGVLLSYVPRPELAVGSGIAREKAVEAALWAAVIGALSGLLVAASITIRLRRIAASAGAIEAGDFARPLARGFPDELGALALTIDRMRERLSESFVALAADRDRLHRLLGRLREGVITVDAALVVEHANASAGTLLAVADLEPGRRLPEPWEDFSLRSFASSLFLPYAEVAQATLSPREDQTLHVVGIPAGADAATAVLVISDVTEGQRRERAQREFVANAAHELRTPLSVISGAVEMLQAGAKETPEERDRFIEHIERESKRLGRLARALLLLARAQSRAEPLRIEPLPLQPLLASAADGMRLPDSVELELSCPPGLHVLAQPELLEQVIVNVLDNARKYTTSGRIQIEARRSGTDSVLVEVRDTGEGIDPDEVHAVFDRFHRSGSRGADGFGLGLAIVREALAALGGQVELSSAPGEGTTVRVTLRAADARVRALRPTLVRVDGGEGGT